MAATGEIWALMRLMDDPDEEIFDIVCQRISTHWGCSMIPYLEFLWEKSPEEILQNRIENLIHRLQFELLQSDLQQWNTENAPNLLDGYILATRYCFPDLNTQHIQDDIHRLYRNIWLELNDYLTSIERFHVLNSVLYHFFKLQGLPFGHNNVNDFLVNKVLESHQGNAMANAILLHILAEKADVPLVIVNIPQHFLLAFYYQPATPKKAGTNKKLLFFLDAASGQTFTPIELKDYLDKMDIQISIEEIRPMENAEIIKKLLEQMSICYANKGDITKTAELVALSEILKNRPNQKTTW